MEMDIESKVLQYEICMACTAQLTMCNNNNKKITLNFIGNGQLKVT